MPWIEAPHEDDWAEEVEDLKADLIDPVWKRVDWIMRIHALDPDSMNAHNVLYAQAMRGTKTLRKVDREMIALIVSKTNDCHY